jgi:hypothetical protein
VFSIVTTEKCLLVYLRVKWDEKHEKKKKKTELSKDWYTSKNRAMIQIFKGTSFFLSFKIFFQSKVLMTVC